MSIRSTRPSDIPLLLRSDSTQNIARHRHLRPPDLLPPNLRARGYRGLPRSVRGWPPMYRPLKVSLSKCFAATPLTPGTVHRDVSATADHLPAKMLDRVGALPSGRRIGSATGPGERSRIALGDLPPTLDSDAGNIVERLLWYGRCSIGIVFHIARPGLFFLTPETVRKTTRRTRRKVMLFCSALWAWCIRQNNLLIIVLRHDVACCLADCASHHLMPSWRTRCDAARTGRGRSRRHH